MTTYTESDLKTQVAITELGAEVKHLAAAVSGGFKRLEDRMDKRDDSDHTKHDLLEARMDAVEKRVDKVYWVWGAAVFVGAPILTLATKYISAQFGL